MRLRGYEGRLRISVSRAADPPFDAALLAAAVALLALAVVFRLAHAALTPYSWLPLAAALVLLLATFAWRLIRR
jgi:hypothetical protein